MQEAPLAKGLPIIGNMLDLIFNPLQGLTRLCRENGPVFRFRAFTEEFLVMAGTDVNRFLSEEGKDCVYSAEFWKDLVAYWHNPDALIALDGKAHIEERRQWKHYVSREVAHNEQQGIVASLKDYLQEVPAGEPVSARGFTRTLVSRELSFLFTGEAIKLEPALASAIIDYQRILFNTLLARKYPRWVLRLPWFRRDEKAVNAFAQELIEKTRRESTGEDSFYQWALRRVTEDPKRSEAELIATFLTPFIAGLDTVANTLLFLIREITENPALCQQVQAELDQAYSANGGEIPAPAELRQLPALFGLIQETLRRYPVAFANMRHASRDFDYAGKTIRKGSQIIFFTAQPHFDPQYFSNPLQFDIERFNPPRSEQKTRYAFSPFGRGPHICLGAAMAESLLLSSVACLLHDYRIEAAEPGKKFRYLFDPSLSLPDGFKVKISKRQNG